jgi:regulator of cell morphogenesis and NO signaling
VAPIFVMLREHGEIWDILDRIDVQLIDDPGAGPASETCHQLLAALERHNAKEEAIVYPRADTVLSSTADTGLRAFLAAGRTPQGWVCDQGGA